MSESEYVPPRVWKWEPEDNGGKFAKINRSEAGPTHEKEQPAGEHPYRRYSLGTPNGVKGLGDVRKVAREGPFGCRKRGIRGCSSAFNMLGSCSMIRLRE